jgi:hypothetical protein
MICCPNTGLSDLTIYPKEFSLALDVCSFVMYV